MQDNMSLSCESVTLLDDFLQRFLSPDSPYLQYRLHQILIFHTHCSDNPFQIDQYPSRMHEIMRFSAFLKCSTVVDLLIPSFCDNSFVLIFRGTS